MRRISKSHWGITFTYWNSSESRGETLIIRCILLVSFSFSFLFFHIKFLCLYATVRVVDKALSIFYVHTCPSLALCPLFLFISAWSRRRHWVTSLLSSPKLPALLIDIRLQVRGGFWGAATLGYVKLRLAALSSSNPISAFFDVFWKKEARP